MSLRLRSAVGLPRGPPEVVDRERLFDLTPIAAEPTPALEPYRRDRVPDLFALPHRPAPTQPQSVRSPLVDGTPVARGSTRSASRKARASALKLTSTM